MEEPKDLTGENQWLVLAHLSALCGFIGIIPFGNVFGPLVVYLLKRNEYPEVAAQAKEALNFQISMTIYFFISLLLILIIIGIFLVVIVVITDLVFTIIASLRASE